MFPDFPDDNKNEDFLNEFRQKIAEQSNISFEERKNDLNRSKSVFIGAVSGIALAAVVGWFVLSPRYAQNENVEIPVIRRPQTAVKVQPTEPGGMEILNQDKSVYDILDKSENNKKVVENLLPPPEEPKLPEIVSSQTDVAPEQDAIADKIADSDVTEQAEKIISIAQAPVASVAQEPKAEAETKPLSQAIKEAAKQEPQPEKTKEETVKISKEDIKSVYTAQIKDGKVVMAKEAKDIPAGVWQVQLISSNKKSSVENSWKNLSKKYSVLAQQPYEIETADLGAKGTYYRLKAGAFKDRAGADNLCNDIKALGGSCIVKKK